MSRAGRGAYIGMRKLSSGGSASDIVEDLTLHWMRDEAPEDALRRALHTVVMAMDCFSDAERRKL